MKPTNDEKARRAAAIERNRQFWALPPEERQAAFARQVGAALGREFTDYRAAMAALKDRVIKEIDR